MQPGRVLLPEVVDDYDPENPERRGHNVVNIKLALDRFDPPPESLTPAGFAAFDVFTGYLIFDALIANGDRHDRNWAVLLRPPGQPGRDALCSSYDHASSLGFTLSDNERHRHLIEGTVARWVGRGYARQFEHRSGAPRQNLVDLARVAAESCTPTVREHWFQAVLSVDPGAVRSILDAAPGLSEVTRDFTQEFVMINRDRLSDALS